MHADDLPWPRRGRADHIDVERRRVGGKDGIVTTQPIESSEHFLLDGHALEYRFDDEVDRCRGGQLMSSGNPGDGGRSVGGTHAAFAGRAVDGCGDAPESRLDNGRILVDQGDVVPGSGEADGNSAAHGTGADNRHLLHRPRIVPRCGGASPLGKEQVTERVRSHRSPTRLEAAPRQREGVVKRLLVSGLDAFDDSSSGQIIRTGSREALAFAGV